MFAATMTRSTTRTTSTPSHRRLPSRSLLAVSLCTVCVLAQLCLYAGATPTTTLAAATIQEVPTNVCPAASHSDACAACNNSHSVSRMQALPRVTLNRRPATPLATFLESLIECNDGHCTWNVHGVGNDVRHVLGGNAANDGNNDGTYFQGFGLYVLLSIILAALATLCGCCFCIGRAWCCCCRHGTCGKRVPTKAAWCCPGYRVRTIKQGFGVPPRTVVEYSPCERWTVRSMALVFVGGCALFSVLTVLQWGPGFTNGVHKLVEAPSAPVNLLRQAQVPLATGVSMVVTGVVMPTLLTLNETINGIVDLNSTNHNMVCVDQTVDNIPDTDELLHQLALANASLFEVKAIDAELRSELSEFNTSLSKVPPTIDTAEAFVHTFTVDRNELQQSIEDTSTAANAVDGVVQQLSRPTTGVAALADNLTLVTAASSYPSSQQISEATTDASSSSTLAKLLSGAMGHVRDDPDRDQLISKLVAIEDKLDAVPLHATTAGLSRVDGIVTSTLDNKLIDNVMTALVATNTSLAKLPSAGDVDAALTPVYNAIKALDLSQVLDELNELQRVGNTFPPLTEDLLAEVAKLEAIKSAVPCLRQLNVQLHAINASLVSLPDNINDIDSMIHEITVTMADALEKAQSFAGEVALLVTALESATKNAASTLDKKTEQLQGAADQLDDGINSAKASMNQVQGEVAVAQAGLTSAHSASSDAKTVFENPALRPSPTTSKDLQDMTALVDTTSDLVARSVASIHAFALGRCDVGSTSAPVGSLCTAASDCGEPSSNLCLWAVRRCVDDFATACPQGLPSECGGGTCLLNAPLLHNTSGYLTAFNEARSQRTPDVSETVTELKALDAQLADMQALTAAQSELDTLSTEVDKVAVDSIQQELSTARSDVAAVDVAPTEQDLAAISTVSDRVPDLGKIEADVRSVQASVATVDADEEQLSSARLVVNALDVFLNVHLPDLQRTMAPLRLEAERHEGGLSGLLRYVGDNAQESVATILNVTATLDPGSDAGEANVSSTLEPIVDILNKLNEGTRPGEQPVGALYTIASLLGADMVPSADVHPGDTVFHDAAGHEYVDGRLCLAAACVNATIERGNSATVADVAGVWMPLNRTEVLILLLVLLFPGLAVLLTLCACMGSFCKGRWQRVPSFCAAACVCCTVPVALLIVGGLLLPAVLVSVDGCGAAANVGQYYLAGSYATVCDGIGGTLMSPAEVQAGTQAGTLHVAGHVGAGSPPLCGLTVLNRTIAFSTGMVSYELLSGDCSSEALSSLVNTLSSTVVSNVPTQLASALNALNDRPLHLRPPLVAILDDAAVVFGSKVGATVELIGGVANCDALHASVDALKGGVCCGVLPPLAAIVGYMSAMVVLMCFCGSCATVMGVKRFPSRISKSVVVDELMTRHGYANLDDGGNAGGQTPASDAVLSPTPVPRRMTAEYEASMRTLLLLEADRARAGGEVTAAMAAGRQHTSSPAMPPAREPSASAPYARESTPLLLNASGGAAEIGTAPSLSSVAVVDTNRPGNRYSAPGFVARPGAIPEATSGGGAGAGGGAGVAGDGYDEFAKAGGGGEEWQDMGEEPPVIVKE